MCAHAVPWCVCVRAQFCGKCFPKKEGEQDTNMLAEMFEAVWGAQFIDSQGNYARKSQRPLDLAKETADQGERAK